MLRIHGKMLVKNFKKAVEDTYGLRLKIHQGFSRGQFADEDGTLAAARSGQAGDTEGSLELRAEMTVRQAKDLFREVAGFGIQVLHASGANADDDALLSAAGFRSSPSPAADAGKAGDTEGSLELRAEMTVRQAKDLFREVAGFGIQVLHASGANADDDEPLSAVGFRAATAAASPAADAGKADAGGGGISVTGQKKLSTIQSEFTAKFAQLGLMFFSLEEAKKSERGEHIRPLSSDQTVASVRTKAAKGDMSIHGNTTVGTIESGFRDDYGLFVQVCYMRDGKPVYTADSLNPMSLAELNRRAAEQGRGAFAYPRH